MLTDEQQQHYREDIESVLAALGCAPTDLHIGIHGYTVLSLPAKRVTRLLAYAALGHHLLHHADPHDAPAPELAQLARRADGLLAHPPPEGPHR